MLRRLLLKNWNDSATCVASTYSTWLRYAALGVPSLRAGEEHRREDALEARGQALEAQAHDSTAPASGPGVWLKSAVTWRRTATHGQTCHVAGRGARQANAVELVEKARTTAPRANASSSGFASHEKSISPFTWTARSSAGRAMETATWPLVRRFSKICGDAAFGT